MILTKINEFAELSFSLSLGTAYVFHHTVIGLNCNFMGRVSLQI